VKKLLRSLEKVWIVGIRLWNTQGNATHQSDLRFPFKKIDLLPPRASENFHKNFVLQKISEKVFC
jgi:hypothetical protein